MKLWAFALLIGCASRVEVVESVADTAVTDSSATDSFVASDTFTRDTFVAADAPVDTSITKDTAPDPTQVPVTAAQAECLGLTRATCKPCHYRDEQWYARPRGGPPPPADHGPADWARCGITPP
jgi:hypothetical protein